MFDPRNILRAEPVAIAEAVRQVLFVLVLLNVFVLEQEALAAIAMAISGVLSLFTRNTVSAPDTVDEILFGPNDEPAGPGDGYDG